MTRFLLVLQRIAHRCLIGVSIGKKHSLLVWYPSSGLSTGQSLMKGHRQAVFGVDGKLSVLRSVMS